jgi:hypothetical protein
MGTMRLYVHPRTVATHRMVSQLLADIIRQGENGLALFRIVAYSPGIRAWVTLILFRWLFDSLALTEHVVRSVLYLWS